MNFPQTWNYETRGLVFVHPNSLGVSMTGPSYTLTQRPSMTSSQNLYLEVLLQQRDQNILQQKILAQISQAFSQRFLIGNSYHQQNLATSEKLCQPFLSLQHTESAQLSPIYPFEINKEKPSEQLKTQINEMLGLFINFYGRDTQDKIREQRARYASNQTLLAIFDSLHQKYRSCTKNREDMVRFVLRKAISSLRDSIRGKYGLATKAASLALCRKYFSSRLQELSDNNVDLEDEDQVLNFLLPYKKNSRNKTVNATFISELFASEEFYQDYVKFLENIDFILEVDNQKRSKKLADFLIICASEGNFAKIKSYKRLPWLKDWFATMKEIAYELLNTSKRSRDHKKFKLF